MAALANVALTDTFDTWQLRINQLVVKSNENEGSVEQGFARANDANSIARSGFAQANTARSHANVAFEGANTARGHANAAFLQANTGRDQANLAFTRANLANQISVGNTLSSVFTLRSSARTRLNFIPSGSVTINVEDDSAGDRVNVTFGVGTADTTSPFIRANIAHSHANAAFEQANTARDRGNSAFTQATDAYTRANTSSVAFPQANTARNQANDAYTRANTKITGTSPDSQGTWTTAGWSTLVKMAPGFVIQWLKGSETHSYGLGVSSNNGFYFAQSAADDNISPVNYFHVVSPTVFTYNGSTIWHAGNDGSGSGLDADTVDGIQGSSLVTTSNYTASDVLTKIKTVDGSGSGLDADTIDGVDSSSLKQVGLETIWIPAVAMTTRTTNGAESSTEETATNRNMLKTLKFDASTQEFAQFFVRMPKSWNESTVTASFSWSHGSGGSAFGVVWQLAGVALSDTDAIEAAFGTAQTVADTGGTANTMYITSSTSAITIAGSPASEDYVMFQVARVPANGSDTLNIDARLHGVTLYFTTNASNDA